MGTTHPKVKLSNPLLFSNFGIATAQIGDNNFGVVTTLGFLFVVDTSLWVNNTLLYSTAIGDLSVVPLGSPVAFVVKQDTNCGVLYVLAITETNHEKLAGLSGGATLEHYHLTATQHTVATQLSSNILTGLLSPTDWTNFNSKQTSALTSSNILVGNASNIASSAVMSGDTTISNTGVVFLKNTGTAGTYDSVTTDAQGRVTAGTNDEWHVLGKTQLTVAANATSIITIPPRTMLRVTCIVTGYSGGGIASLRFGTVAGAVDTGNNYNTRFLRAATGASNSFTDVPTTTTNFLRLASQNIVLGRQYTVNITNYPTVRKMCSISTSSEAGAVGVAPTLDWGQGMYANNTAQIITIQLISTANNLSIGSGFIVEGVNLI